MHRRAFVQSMGLLASGAAGGATLAAPAIAQSNPDVKWRLTSSFPKNLDIMYGAAETISNRVSEVTEGRFQIQVFAGGEIVPGLQALDAVQVGAVECAHTASYAYVGKDPTFAFDTAIPFGLNARQQNAWILQGGGRELMEEFFRGYNVRAIAAGNTGAQMGGWFRQEISALEDLDGLKFRIGGFAGRVVAKLGVVPQLIAGGDTYPALERGAIDAAEWIGPYDDEKLGFNKVAPYYYYPGWWEGGPLLSLYVNLDAWNKLPKTYQSLLEVACADANQTTLAKYDAGNPAALKRLIAGGTKLRLFKRPIMEACFKAANELYDETAAANPVFKKVYETWKPFRDDEFAWFRICETNYDNFAFTAAEKGR